MKALSMLLLILLCAGFATAQQILAPSWFDRYNGPSNGYDDAGAICTDAAGNYYVAGTSPPSGNSLLSFVVIKYSAGGARQWVARHTVAGGKATQVAVDSQSNVFASGYRWGGSNYEEVLVKFNSAGQEQWSRRLNGRPIKLLSDSQGGVYAIGTFNDGYDSDWSIMRFSPIGKAQWEVRYDDMFARNDVIANAVFDGAGNLVVAGTAGIDSGSSPGDIVLAKIAPDGRILWQESFTRGGTLHEFADDVGLDSAGNIYVIGGAANSGNIYEQAADLWLKFTPSGELIGQTLGGPAVNGDMGGGAVDANGNLYFVSFSRVLKYSPHGVLLWQNEITSPPLGVTIPLIAYTAQREVVVAGTTYEGTANYDYLILGYSPEGVAKWQYRYDGPIGGSDKVEGLATTAKGDVFVTGTSWNQYSSIGGTADDIVTMKFTRAFNGSR